MFRAFRVLFVMVGVICMLPKLNWAAESDTGMPRLFVADGDAPYCVIETDLEWRIIGKRQIETEFRRVLDLVSSKLNTGSLAFFTDTDFIGLNHFALFYDRNCTGIGEEAATLKEEIMGMVGYRLSQLTMVSYANSSMVVDRTTAISLHDYPERNKKLFSDCVVAIDYVRKPDDRLKIINSLSQVSLKYQFPIVDFAYKNDSAMFILLFDQCDHKLEIVRLAMAWSDMAEEFARPDLYSLEDVSADRYFALSPD